MTWNDFWAGSGGIQGNFDYGTTHLVATAILIFLTITLSIVAKKTNRKTTRIILLCVAWFQIIFEVFWRVVYLIRGESLANLWPLYPCNLAGIIVPIAVILNNTPLKKIFYLFGFIGGVITFIMPQGIFTNAYLSFGILKSVLQHTSLILIPVIEFVSGEFRPKLKDFGWVTAGLFIHILNSEVVSLVIGLPGDYMFFRSGLPFVIPYIPQFITLGVFGLLVIFAINVAVDINGTKKVFRKIFKNDSAKLDVNKKD